MQINQVCQLLYTYKNPILTYIQVKYCFKIFLRIHVIYLGCTGLQNKRSKAKVHFRVNSKRSQSDQRSNPGSNITFIPVSEGEIPVKGQILGPFHCQQGEIPVTSNVKSEAESSSDGMHEGMTNRPDG